MRYPRVLTEAATLQAAHLGSSIARYGDGELKLCRGRSAKSQEHQPALSAMLSRILLDTSGPCLPCIPRLIADGPKHQFWKEFYRPPWTRLYAATGSYGSSFITRPDSAPDIDNAGYWASIDDLWKGRDVVLIRGSTKSLTAERLWRARSVHEIVGPVQHAWKEHRDIFENVRDERRRVILCLGATATVLAWMLSYEGVHALDLGHVGMFTKRIGPDGTVGAAHLSKKD